LVVDIATRVDVIEAHAILRCCRNPALRLAHKSASKVAS
jgi:hypothetical protein